MSKKLLFDSEEPSFCYERLVIGYPIQILDEGLCETHSTIILSIKGDEIGVITLDTYNPYYKIDIDGNKPINIKVNIAMKKNKTKEQKK